MAPAFEQVVWLPPADAEGAVVKVKVFVEVAAEHGELAATVKVSVTEPAVKSATLGVYVGLIIAVLLNEPVPLVLQVIPAL